jgi:hypothetical protein
MEQIVKIIHNILSAKSQKLEALVTVKAAFNILQTETIENVLNYLLTPNQGQSTCMCPLYIVLNGCQWVSLHYVT